MINRFYFSNSDEVDPSNRTNLDRYKEFVKTSSDSIERYDNTFKSLIRDVYNTLSNVDLTSTRSSVKELKSKISKDCNNVLFLEAKSKELVSVISKYSKISIYEDKNCEEFLNKTQKLYIQKMSNLDNEYPTSSAISGVSVSVINIGFDEDRSLRIVTSIVNEDLKIDISSEKTIDIHMDRMSVSDIEVSQVETPTQQCRAKFSVDIYNQNGNLLGSQSKELFFS